MIVSSFIVESRSIPYSFYTFSLNYVSLLIMWAVLSFIICIFYNRTSCTSDETESLTSSKVLLSKNANYFSLDFDAVNFCFKLNSVWISFDSKFVYVYLNSFYSSCRIWNFLWTFRTSASLRAKRDVYSLSLFSMSPFLDISSKEAETIASLASSWFFSLFSWCFSI